MRKIKFRGKRLDNGELIYGDLLHYGKYEVCIRSYSSPDKNSFSTLPIDSKSIAQFVGYDSDGNGVYEGDICHCEELGDCHIALIGYSVPGYLPFNSKEIEWHLKERGENENLS